MITLVHLVVSLGMLVIVPLGLSLVTVGGGATVRRWWPVAAVPGVISLWLGRGDLSIALACIYAAGTLALVVLAAADLVRRRRLRAREVALYTALVTPAIAALALVAERSSHELFGFKLTVLSLTVAHFHFAGFAAALVACLVVESTSGRVGTAAAISVPLGTGIVLLGFFVGNAVELLGAAVLTAGMWLVGWAMWQRSRAADRVTKTLLTVSAAVLVATMLLALSWALGHVVATPYLPLRWMVATHGVANALGFALCGLLAWRRLKEWDEAR